MLDLRYGPLLMVSEKSEKELVCAIFRNLAFNLATGVGNDIIQILMHKQSGSRYREMSMVYLGPCQK